jgi:hypothetical protein
MNPVWTWRPLASWRFDFSRGVLSGDFVDPLNGLGSSSSCALRSMSYQSLQKKAKTELEILHHRVRAEHPTSTRPTPLEANARL